MRGDLKKRLPFPAGFADESECRLFQVSKTSVNQFGRAGACAVRKISLVDQSDVESPERGVAGCTRAGDSAADDEKIMHALAQTVDGAGQGDYSRRSTKDFQRPMRSWASARLMAGRKIFSWPAGRVRLDHTPAPMPANRAAPHAVASVWRGRMIGTPRRSD